MRYIASIREEGQKYGICKVIPPSEKWLHGQKMTDIVDPKTYIFPTKVQSIHQLQTRNGPCSRFLDELDKFLEKRKTPMKNIPILDGHELDLYRLYKGVMSRGGMDQVCLNNCNVFIAQGFNCQKVD
jgi:histone demethylase JARID1